MVHVKQFDYSTLQNITEMVVSKDRNGEVIRYYNYPFTFDIESSSFYTKQNNKMACMYAWAMTINGVSVYGRTWKEFTFFMEELKLRLHLDYHNRIIIYIHNLSYEFQFIRRRFIFSKVFARKKRHPIKALMDNCFELKCSYFLSGLSLEKTAENLSSVKVKKKVGQLDYDKVRHSETPLEKEELEYLEYDVIILHFFIMEEIRKNKNDISKIPLTKTGYARNYCREYIKKHTNFKQYRTNIEAEAPTDVELFTLLNKAFAGGYTHANKTFVETELPNVDYNLKVHSIDFTSSYPAQMCMHMFPRGNFKRVQIESKAEFESYIRQYACVFKITFENLKSKKSHDILSESKCEYLSKPVIDNGRIYSAQYATTFMTDVDYKTFEKFYDWDNICIHDFWYTVYGYLPKQLLECVLTLYANKTKLKGVIGKEEEYLVAKGLVNAIYGMCVTNPVNDEILYSDDEWNKEEPLMQQALNKAYINNYKQFLCYQWGVWITAWARYELLDLVSIVDFDAIYMDTDSIKLVNYDKYVPYIEKHNKRIKENLLKCVHTLCIDESLLNPIDIKGKGHFLGIWDYEGEYIKFKTLGAKRYAYIKKMKESGKEEFHITVSGLSNKQFRENGDKGDIITKSDKDYLWKNATNYIVMNGGFKFFTDGMKIPKEFANRLVHTYVDEYQSEVITDYKGNSLRVEEFSCIHLERSDYTCGLSDDFKLFLECLADDELDPEHFVPKKKRKELEINTTIKWF